MWHPFKTLNKEMFFYYHLIVNTVYLCCMFNLVDFKTNLELVLLPILVWDLLARIINSKNVCFSKDAFGLFWALIIQNSSVFFGLDILKIIISLIFIYLPLLIFDVFYWNKNNK